ncbi:MAG: AAA family ATPase, partial [Gaiellaceae bacterium]
TALRVHLGKKLSDQFKDAGVELQVSVKFRSGELVDEYELWLRKRIGKRFLHGDRVTQFCRSIHPIDLAADARSSVTTRILSLKDDKKAPFFAKVAEAQEFIGVLKDSIAELFALETIVRGDRPEITLSANKEGRIIPAPFGSLSFGQKASILLGALLFSDRQDPLVIDQPEDHLDSAFIYEAVVRTLRRVKERRQVIVATHNANIAVLGDAELIVPLRSWTGKGLITDRGSVDASKTRKRACTILEGGEQAYRRRGEMYGFSSS